MTISLTDTDVDAAARHLLALHQSSSAGPRLPPALRPGQMADGWRIQQRVSSLRGTPVLGWKSALPRPDRWGAGAIHEAVPAGGSLRAPQGAHGMPRIEPELAFAFAQDLPARDEPYTAAEVDAAIGGIHLAVEVLGCRYEDPASASGAELLADHMWNQGLVLGPRVAAKAEQAEMALALSIPGQPDREIAGRHPDGDPRLPVYWLAEFLRTQGRGLTAGQVVITGSFAGAIEVPFGQRVALRYGEWGEVSFQLDRLVPSDRAG